MSSVSFQLFGKFCVMREKQSVAGLEPSKEQELLSYLLIHRDRSHPREALASLLWGDSPTEKSRKYLRQALWHLHAALHPDKNNEQLLMVEHDWVQLNPRYELCLDVAVIEEAFVATHGVPGKQLSKADAEMLRAAVEHYKGDLLEGWYQDWCLFERERFQNMYLSMLSKLISYCLEFNEYERGQVYGATILRFDRASERTYRQLMHLQYMSGDRTGALRQYDRCVNALREELGVKPERRTTALYEKIRSETLNKPGTLSDYPIAAAATSLPEVLSRLKQLQLVLSAVQSRVNRDIKAVEQGLKR